MPTADRSALERIARDITDGKAVDWHKLEATYPDLVSRLRHMQRIQSLVESSRWPQAGTPVAAPDAPAPSVPFTWGPLQALERIGEGSFGEVYRAFEPALQREVALKLMRSPLAPGEESLAHLEEARRLARVRHPNVLTVHGVEIHGGRPGMWTDFLRGETLERRIRGSDPMGAEEIAAFAGDLCKALGAVHAAGIIHGDVKAANVMCEADGRTILMDFGAGSILPSRTPPEKGAASRKTKRPAVGTPLVMAPELLLGDPPTIASDLYALGVLLYRLATGRYPIEAKTTRELLARHRKGMRLRLSEIRPDLPQELTQAIERSLASEPSLRFRDAVEMGNTLAASVGLPPIGAGPSGGAVRPDRLPRPKDRFVGREHELSAIRRLTVKSPIVTLVGPGGSGKTRLAMQAALDLRDAFPDGAFWIDLAPVGEPSGVWAGAAQVLGVRESPQSPLEQAIAEQLSGQSALLVLDNCEHLLAECARFVRHVRAQAPKVRILATSREALGAAEEARLDVAPLTLPPAAGRKGQGTGLEIVEYEAVRLFLDRAHQSRPGFTLTRTNAPAVAAICRRLEGLPLAIELAAARVKVLSPEEIVARLEESFRILVGAAGERLPRQRTLDALIDWSVRLLSPPEQILLRRLAVFSGRWTLEAAEQACRDPDDADPMIQGEPILDLMAALVEKSLVGLDAGISGPAEELVGRPINAYRMLEVVRRYAGERLLESGEADAVELRHLRSCVATAKEALVGLNGPEESWWTARLDWEHENFLAVFRWVPQAPQHVDEAIVAALNLGRYWHSRSLFRTGRQVLESLLSIPTASDSLRGRALAMLAGLALGQGDDALVARASDEALALMERDREERGRAEVLGILGLLRIRRGELDEAVRRFEEALEVRRRLNEPTYTATVLLNLGVAWAYKGDLSRARDCYHEALTSFDSVGERRGSAQAAANLAATALDQNDLAEAKRWASDTLQRLRAIGGNLDTGSVLAILATIAREEGDARTARSRELELVSVRTEQGVAHELARSLAGLACTCKLEGDWEKAARLFGAFETQVAACGLILDPGAAARLERDVLATRTHLGADRYADLHAMGRGLSLEQALALAGAGDALGPPRA